MRKYQLDFELPLIEMEKRLEELKRTPSAKHESISEQIIYLESQIEKIRKNIYENLSPWQRVQIARHPDRPVSSDYIERLFSNFIELHGDRLFGDDHSMITGFGMFGHHKVAIIAEEKGKDTRDRVKRNFGMPHPEGYRKALRVAKLAEKFNLPVVCFIDTAGAYPGVGAEERGQGAAIANNLMHFSQLKTLIIVVNIGEGGSGGALAIGIGDKVFMLENAYYSVISPEGCASILYGENSVIESKAAVEEAAMMLKLTAQELYGLGFIDAIIPEPMGGAHRDVDEVVSHVNRHISAEIDHWNDKKTNDMVERRNKKLRSFGVMDKSKKVISLKK